MKPYNYLLIVFLFSFGVLKAQEIATTTNLLNIAYAEAQKENKNIFVLFEASWCGWCKKMKTNLNNESIKNLFAKNYVFVNLTVLESKNNKHLENPGAEDLLNQFGGENQGIPYYLIFSNQGQLLADSKMIKDKEVLIGEGENIGCPEADFEIDAFIYKIQETSNLNSNELMLIAKQFASTNH